MWCPKEDLKRGHSKQCDVRTFFLSLSLGGEKQKLLENVVSVSTHDSFGLPGDMLESLFLMRYEKGLDC